MILLSNKDTEIICREKDYLCGREKIGCHIFIFAAMQLCNQPLGFRLHMFRYCHTSGAQLHTRFQHQRKPACREREYFHKSVYGKRSGRPKPFTDWKGRNVLRHFPMQNKFCPPDKISAPCIQERSPYHPFRKKRRQIRAGT